MEDHRSDGAGGDQPAGEGPAPASGAPPPEPPWTEPGPPPGPNLAWETGAERPLVVPGAPGFVFAPMLARITGFVLDSLVLFVIELLTFAVVTAIIGSPEATSALFDPLAIVDPAVIIASSLIGVLVSWLYFVGSWRSSQRATPGQRLVKIQVGRAFDGRTLTIEQGTSRWFAMAFPFQAFSAIPAISEAATALIFLWYLILVFATAVSGTRQGPHDRFARSAVVQRAGLGQSGLVLGCIVVIALVAFAIIASLVALVALGPQLEQILREVGESI